MSTLALLLALTAITTPPQQNVPPRDAVAPATGSSAISGRVTDKDTGRPLHRAMVLLIGAGQSLRREAVADAEGRYEFRELPPGEYSIVAFPGELRATHLSQEYGQSTPLDVARSQPRPAVALKADEIRPGVDVALSRALAIEGRVLDGSGEPISNVQLKLTRVDGTIVWGSGSVSSDDRGEYRLFGLEPGRYRVCASAEASGLVAPPGASHPVDTCYPAAVVESSADDIVLLNENATGIDIRMQRVGTSSVSGSVVDESGATVEGAAVNVVLVDGRARNGGARTTSAGRFALTGLIPGRYIVNAWFGGSATPDNTKQPPRERELGSASVEIAGTDVDGIVVTTAKGQKVAGRVILDGRPVPRLDRLTVQLHVPRSAWNLMTSRAPYAPVADDLRFELTELYRLPLTVGIQGVPDGWALKSVRYNGRDITDLPTDFAALKGRIGLEVVLTNRVAQPGVKVVDDEASPVLEYFVVMLPSDSARWQNAQLGTPGRYSTNLVTKLGAVVPGEVLRGGSYVVGGPSARAGSVEAGHVVHRRGSHLPDRGRPAHDRTQNTQAPTGTPMTFLLPLWLILVQAAQAVSPGTGEIRGRITDQESGRPIPRAVVRLETGSGDTRLATQTDDEGRYEFTGLNPGTYALSADVDEFRTTHLERLFGEPPRRDGRLTLKEAEVRKDVNIALPRALAMQVRVVDEWGEPLARVRVDVKDAVTRRSLFHGYTRGTDDRGLLRAFPLEAGQYIVCAEPGVSTSFGTSSNAGKRDRFVRTCHPSVPSESDATPIVLKSSAAGEVEIRFLRSRVFSISGTILDASGVPAEAARVSFVRYGRNGVSAGVISSKADGGFQVSNVEPGEYAIEASVGGSDRPEQKRPLELAHVPVRVDSSDIQDLVVTMSRTVEVAGHVTLEDSAAPFRPGGSGLMITPRMPEGATFSTGSQATAYMAENREFLLKRMYGRRLLDFANVPRGWYVKAVRYRDRDVTDVPTEFRASTDPSALEIVMSTRGAMLSGRVLDEIGNPVTGASVVVFSADRARWNDVRLTVVPVSKEGTYQAGPLRGGDYLIVPLDPSAIPPQPATRSELAPLAETAERITLSGEGQQTMDLRLVKRE